MMTTCGMIYVTPYVVEERFNVSKIGFKPTGWLRNGIATGTTRYERWRWRGVRHMGLPIQRHEEHTDDGARQ